MLVQQVVGDTEHRLRSELRDLAYKALTESGSAVPIGGVVESGSAGGATTSTFSTAGSKDLSEKELVAELVRRRVEQDKRQRDAVTSLTLANKVDDLSAALIAMQDQASDRDRDTRVELRAMERKVDESVEIATRSVLTASERCAGLEGRLRDAALDHRDVLDRMRTELGERLNEGIDKVSAELLGQERRVTVMEKISEDVLARLQLSASAMDAYFASSPDVRRFHESATRLDRMEVLMGTVRDNTVDIGAGLTTVRAMTQVCFCPTLPVIVYLTALLNTFVRLFRLDAGI